MTGAIPEQHEIDGFQLNKDLSQPPHFIDGADTLCKLWSTRCRNLGQRTFIMFCQIKARNSEF